MEIYGWAIGNTNGREKEMAKAAVNRTVGRTCSALTFQIMQFSGLCVCVCRNTLFILYRNFLFSSVETQLREENDNTPKQFDDFCFQFLPSRQISTPSLSSTSSSSSRVERFFNELFRSLTDKVFGSCVYTFETNYTVSVVFTFFLTKTRKKNIPIYFGCQTFSGWNIPSTKSEYCIGFYDPPKLSCWQLNRHQILQFTDSIAKKFGKSTVEIQQMYRAPEKSVPCRGLERDRQNV